MKNPWAHRCAIVVAVLTLLVIILGSCLTSEIRTFPGAAAPSIVTAPSLAQVHRVAGYAALVSLCLIWFLRLTDTRVVVVAGLTAMFVILLSGTPIAHALLAPVSFSFVVAIAVLTSNGWQRGPEPVASPWRPLRLLGLSIPILMVIQIGLGSSFRHNSMGVLWHILNALIVLVIVMVAGVAVIRQFPAHVSLRPAALALLIVTGVQVMLGFSVYLVLLMSSENNTGLIVTGVLHVTNGALTLAASVVFAMQLKRNLIELSGV